MRDTKNIKIGKEVIQIEAQAVLAISDRIDCCLLDNTRGVLVRFLPETQDEDIFTTIAPCPRLIVNSPDICALAADPIY